METANTTKHKNPSAKTWLHSGLQPQNQLLFWPQVSVSCLQHTVCYSILPTPKGLSHAFMETALPNTELIQMDLGINSAFVQLLTRRRKLLRQSHLEPLAPEAHSTASFHWDKVEYLPWSTLWMLILCGSLWSGSDPTASYRKPDLYLQGWTFSAWSYLLKPLLNSRQNMLDYWLLYTILEDEGHPKCFFQEGCVVGNFYFTVVRIGPTVKNTCSSLFGRSTGAEGQTSWLISFHLVFLYFLLCRLSCHIYYQLALYCMFYRSV